MAWLTFDSLVNARDLGGTPCRDGGRIADRKLIRSDNLQDLTPADLATLAELGVSDVVDLRSTMEVDSEGPTALQREDHGITVHHLSYLPEVDPDPDGALPWVGRAAEVDHDDYWAASYLTYLHDRPDNVIAALRTIAYADGATLVHCAAGKDRTGTTVALALSLAGAEPEAIAADYAASGERMQLIIDRLSASPTYAANLAGRSLDSHMTHAETMHGVLSYLEDKYGGVEAALMQLGWTGDDTAAMISKLRGSADD